MAKRRRSASCAVKPRFEENGSAGQTARCVNGPQPRFEENGSAGQTLVELAVTLPLLSLAVVVAVQLIAYGHNAVVLQMLAAKAARQAAAGERPSPSAFATRSLWGRATSPIPRSSSQVLQPWRPFRAPLKISSPGYEMSWRVQSRLFPGAGFARLLPSAPQQATAEAYVEPPLPQED